MVDYKTGKAPELKYSEKTNQRIMDEKFFQLQVSEGVNLLGKDRLRVVCGLLGGYAGTNHPRVCVLSAGNA